MKTSAVFMMIAGVACTPTQEPQRPAPTAKAAVPHSAPPVPVPAPTSDKSWQERAAAYLDARSLAWLESPPRAGQRHNCAISCHTTFPYLFSRPLLGEGGEVATLRLRIEQRVEKAAPWGSQTPWYGKDGSQRARESLGSEAVLSAVALALHDRAIERPASPLTVKAVSRMWERQRADGGFDWLDFGLQPWEAGNETWGAAMAALAAGLAPDGQVPEAVDRLRGFIRGRTGSTLHDRLAIVWASMELDGLLDAGQRRDVIAEVATVAHPSGGWSNAALIGSRTETARDAYATAFATLVLCVAAKEPVKPPSLEWLRQIQREDGAWPAPSANGDSTRGARFMTDAASAYAIMALTACRPG